MFFIAINNKRWALVCTLTAIFENVKDSEWARFPTTSILCIDHSFLKAVTLLSIIIMSCCSAFGDFLAINLSSSNLRCVRIIHSLISGTATSIGVKNLYLAWFLHYWASWGQHSFLADTRSISSWTYTQHNAATYLPSILKCLIPDW